MPCKLKRVLRGVISLSRLALVRRSLLDKSISDQLVASLVRLLFFMGGGAEALAISLSSTTDEHKVVH